MINSKRQELLTQKHSVVSQKTLILSDTLLRTSNLALKKSIQISTTEVGSFYENRNKQRVRKNCCAVLTVAFRNFLHLRFQSEIK